MSELFERCAAAIVEGDVTAAESLAHEARDRGLDASEVLARGFAAGMREAGERWDRGELFLPEVAFSAEAMKAAAAVFEDDLAGRRDGRRRVVIGTVEGDIHDIGKMLVAILLTAHGYEVFDLGVDVPAARFVDEAERREADLVCLSALLTTTMAAQRDVIEAFVEAGTRGRHRVLVGGAPTNDAWAQRIGADGYAADAMAAVRAAEALW